MVRFRQAMGCRGFALVIGAHHDCREAPQKAMLLFLAAVAIFSIVALALNHPTPLRDQIGAQALEYGAATKLTPDLRDSSCPKQPYRQSPKKTAPEAAGRSCVPFGPHLAGGDSGIMYIW